MIVVDVETTGTNPDRHAIVAIGAIELEHPERQFYRECRIWDGAQVQDEALAVNGFTHEQVVDPARLPLHEAMGQFIAWCRDAKERTIGGHNANFDQRFLQASADRCNLAWHFGHRVLDTHSFCWMHMMHHQHRPPASGGRSSLGLDGILTYCGLPEEPKPHHGLMGAKLEAEVFSRLLWGRSLLDEFATHPVPAYCLPPGVTPPAPDQSTLL